MKRNAKLFGIAALVAAMVFAMAACDTGTSPGGNSGGGEPTVTGITLTPASATVAKGGSQQFTASVAGTNSPAQTVTWSITVSGTHADTKIVNGLLTVAAAETKTSLRVRATSTVDTSKYGEAVVTVSGAGTPTVSTVTIDPTSATVAKGGTQQFTATVTGTNNPAQTVTWEITTPGINANTKIVDGLLTVAASETKTSLTVRATSTVDTSRYGEAVVTVSGGGSGTPTVSAVTITPASATIAKGGTQQFTASVAGTNNPAQSVSWSITTSGIDAGTKIVNGLLTVAASETKTSLTVRATSTVDTSRYGEAVVTVSGGGATLATYAGDWINDADIEIEISSYAGGRNWSISVDKMGIYAQDITLTGDIISLNRWPEETNTIRVALGTDGKLTVSEATGRFATYEYYPERTTNGVYTKQP